MISDWRNAQRRMFDNAELQQDARIKEFFKDDNTKTTFTYGDVDYFKNFFSNYNKPYHNALIVFNEEIEYNEFVKTINELQQILQTAKKICIAINKFVIYSDKAKQDVNDDYDSALIDVIIEHFSNFKLDRFTTFDKELKGDKFNFASPYTQIYMINENN